MEDLEHVTYEELQIEAGKFLAKCGVLTMQEMVEAHETDLLISANEMLGMATRIIAGEALAIQKIADEEERKSNEPL